MRTKLLIIGIASSLVVHIGGCTKETCRPSDHIELTTLYINESSMPIRIKSFNTDFSDSTYSVQSVREYLLATGDTLTLDDAPLYYNDSVFILFDNQKVIKNRLQDEDSAFNVYNMNEYQRFQPNPDIGYQITEIYRFTPEHMEAAADLNE